MDTPPVKEGAKIVVEPVEVKDGPIMYSNHATVTGSGEEVYLTFFLRQDWLGRPEGGDLKSPTIPLATVIMTPGHAQRVADVLNKRVKPKE